VLAVLVVDAGLALSLLGFLGLLRPIRRLGMPTRRRAGAFYLLGLAIAATGALLPAPKRRAAAATSRLDEVIPVWQFDERHETRIRASPAEVEAAIRDVTAREIGLFRLLTWLRNPRLPGSEEPESILAAPADEPILAVALRTGFQVLAREPGRELVFGAVVLAPASLRALPPAELERLRSELTPEKFRALAEPGYAKAVMNFRWTDEGGGWTRLTTETRIVATDPPAKRRFAVYWRLIEPGSSLIRRTWLAAIRRRAEAPPRAGAPGPV
jgi:hypothetical protein